MCIGGKVAAQTSLGDKGFLLGLRKAFDSALTSAIYGGAPPPAAPAVAKVPQPPSQGPTEKQRAAQALQEEKEREKKAKQQEKERVEAEKKSKIEADKRAKEDAQKRSKEEKNKAKNKGKGVGGDEKEEKKGGLFSRLLQNVVGEKQVDLGEENLLYFNEKMGCWVEKGKEHEVATAATSAPPPMMASFGQNGMSDSPAPQNMMQQPPDAGFGAPAQAPGGGMPMMGMPGPGGMMGGAPPGGNMFQRQARTGARSRYVDTLNPGAGPAAASPQPMMGGGMGGMPMPNMGGMPGGMTPPTGGTPTPAPAKPKYTVFVPKAAAAASQENGDAPQQ
jgi:hypothetical protein